MSFARDTEQVELLKKSLSIVGHIHPVVRNPKNRNDIWSGRHRKFADSNWPEKDADTKTVRLFIEANFPQITGKLKEDLSRELIIIHGNVMRQPDEEETGSRLLRIARIFDAAGIEKNHVCAEVAKVVTYSERHVERLLPTEYKMESKRRDPSICRHESANQIGVVLKEGQERGKEIKTALDNLGKTATGEPSYPFPNCKCRECDNRSLCGY